MDPELEWLALAVARAARDAFARLRAGCRTPGLWLYYKEGALCFAEERPSGRGWRRCLAGPLPSDLTIEEVALWTSEHARRLPCIPPLRVPA